MTTPAALPIVVDQPPGLWRLGNKLFQIALARQLSAALSRPSVICGIDIPPFRDDLPHLPRPQLEHPLVLDRDACNQPLDPAALERRLAVDGHDGIVITGWGTRLATVSGSRALFTRMLDGLRVPAPAFDGSVAVVSLRLGDAQQDPPVHPDYGPLPIEFYEQALADLGLDPVFVGQLTPGPYLDALRGRWPRAPFLQPGVLDGFEILRRAQVKVVSVSTYAWLAAWLGAADSHVVLPVAGALNPHQRPDWDLLPWADPRYAFRWLAPLRRSAAVPLADHLVAWHSLSDGYPVVRRVPDHRAATPVSP